MISMITGLAVTLLISAPLEEVRIPLPSPATVPFLVQTRPGIRPDMALLEGAKLRIVSIERKPIVTELMLPEGTSVFDVADIDGDERYEIVGVQADPSGGARVYRLPITEGAVPAPLFSVAGEVALASGQPRPEALLVDFEGGQFLAIVNQDTLELRTLEGRVAHTYSIGENAPQRVSIGLPFMATTFSPPQISPWIGVSGATAMPLEGGVYKRLESEPALPDELLAHESSPVRGRRATIRQMNDARGTEYSNWPWFPLRRSGDGPEKVLFAIDSDTIVRITTPAASDARRVGEAVIVGPERRYPGFLVNADEETPDFNGDGYTDLLLWSADEPGTSIDAISRAVTARTWKVRLTIHLYNEEKQRFEPKTAAIITTEVPVRWFLDAGGDVPLQFVSLADLNGDGRNDLSFSDSPGHYCVHLAHDATVSGACEFALSQVEQLQGILFREDIRGDGSTALGIRSKDAVHIILSAE